MCAELNCGPLDTYRIFDYSIQFGLSQAKLSSLGDERMSLIPRGTYCLLGCIAPKRWVTVRTKCARPFPPKTPTRASGEANKAEHCQRQ